MSGCHDDVGNADALGSLMQHRGRRKQLQCKPDVDDDQSCWDLSGNIGLPKRQYDRSYQQLRYDFGLGASRRSHVLPVQQHSASGDERRLSELRYRNDVERKHMSGFDDDVGDTDTLDSLVQHRGRRKQLQR
jgi:hypothetical protein